MNWIGALKKVELLLHCSSVGAVINGIVLFDLLDRQSRLQRFYLDFIMGRYSGSESAWYFTWINYTNGYVSTKQNKAPDSSPLMPSALPNMFYFSSIL